MFRDSEKLLPYFVYTIFDPTNYKPFYVGKGKGKRDEDHKDGDKDPKEKKIKEIRSRGQKDIRIIIGRYKTKEEALSVETTLIKWIYGYDNLTNQNRGHNNIFIRPQSQLRDKSFEHMVRIDRPKSYETRDGNYTKELHSQTKENKVLEKLATLKEIVKNKFPNLIISEEQILTALDPCILIKGFSKFIQIQIRMPPNSGKYFTFNYLSSKRNYKNEFLNLISKKYPSQKIPSGGAFGRYFTYKENNQKVKIHFDENFKTIKILDNMIKKING